MKSVIRLALVVVVLTGISSWAQRGAAPRGSVGGVRPAVQPSAASSSHSDRGPVTLGRPGWCNRGNCNWNRGEWGGYWPGNYWGYGPYSVGGLDPYWELGEPVQPQQTATQQPSVIMVREPEPKAPPAPPASPKVIEVPQDKAASGERSPSAGPVPPAVFILTDGQRLESRRYLLTQDTLQLQHGRDQQTIPLSKVDLDATVAANHTRGIDLQIPDSKNQLTLGF